MIETVLGRSLCLPIRRIVGAGAFLAIDPLDDQEDDVVLLPSAELADDAAIGDVLQVFIYLDSEDRPIATTRTPAITLGEVAFLEVMSVSSIGAFVDWGLPKELFVPFAEQARELRVGQRHPIGLYVDKSDRLAGTMYVTDMLGRPPRRIARDEWIEGEAWRNDPDIGLFAILERTYVGLVPATEPHRLARGDRAKFRVAHVLPDGKVVLSLRQLAHKERANDAETILAVLSRAGAPRVGDHSDPQTIRELFGLSKKAFKRALGGLLKDRKVTLDERGFVVVLR
ncbi:MAG: S1-like domain-containing RNA-binding protein [Kofleriaceae bacterium]|nr:S1-like domain-containing RNA-binding protein [Kofleriaceae bacterium]